MACNSSSYVEQPVVASKATPATIEFVQATLTPVAPTATPTQERRDLENGRQLAARVNEQPLYLDVYREQVEEFSTVFRNEIPSEEVKERVLDDLLTQLIMEQQAEALGLSVTDAEVEAETNTILMQMTADEVELWFQQNNLSHSKFLAELRSQFLARKLFEYITRETPSSVQQIQIRYIRVSDETTARNMIAQLKQGEAFEEIAGIYSLDAANSQDVGGVEWLVRGNNDLPAEVETIAFTLRLNEVSGPIYTSNGLYIIKLEDKDPARLLSEDDLIAHKNKIFTDWLNEQRALARIESFVALY